MQRVWLGILLIGMALDAQALGGLVRRIALQQRGSAHPCAGFSADLVAVVQGTGDGRNGKLELARELSNTHAVAWSVLESFFQM